MKSAIKRIIPRSLWARARTLERTARHRVCRAGLWLLRYLPDGQVDLMTIMWETGGLTPDHVIRGYAQGLFAAPLHSGPMRWHDPDKRSVLSLTEFHIPKRFRSYLNKQEFEIRFDTDFRGVLDGCSATGPGRETTFLSKELLNAFEELHRRGVTHSVEAYQNGELVGGLYGLALGGMFSISSMFHRTDNASKVALIYLTELLRRNGFVLLDTWWMQPHFALFGAVEIPRAEFKQRLAVALVTPAVFRIPTEPMVVDYRDYQ